MRGSVWPGLIEAAAANLARQQDRVRFFEIGKTFHGALKKPTEVVRVSAIITGDVVDKQWGNSVQAVDFFDIKSDLEALIRMTGTADQFNFVAAEHVALAAGTSCTNFA